MEYFFTFDREEPALIESTIANFTNVLARTKTGLTPLQSMILTRALMGLLARLRAQQHMDVVVVTTGGTDDMPGRVNRVFTCGLGTAGVDPYYSTFLATNIYP